MPGLPFPLHIRRSRIVAFVLALALVVGNFGVLVKMGLIDFDLGPTGGGTLLSIQIGKDKNRGKPNIPVVRQPMPITTPTPLARIATTVVAPVPPPAPASGFIHMSHDDMAMADIAHMPQPRPTERPDVTTKTYGPGEGPGGAHLYPADWYREPGGDEIGPYLRNGVPPGSWATIACKTAPHYRVEDCEELDESPPGSGLSRALRLASWQFQVLPPRINGAVQMGVWVKIHWYWTAPHADADSPPRAVDGN